MIIRTFAASVLALGLLSPLAFAADNGYCDTMLPHRSDYAACNGGVQSVVVSADARAFAIPGTPRTGKWRSIGSYIDETAEERNQRSSNR